MSNSSTECQFCQTDVSSSYIGKECFWVDKVTHKKTYDGRKLGKCVGEGVHSTHKLPIVWFEKPFLGFNWQYKSNVRYDDTNNSIDNSQQAK